MTVKIPADNILDKILRLFGKKRKIIISKGTNQAEKKYGPYSTTIAKKESFWKALFDKKKQKN
jgi:hypothetical protein